jgi:hypothetical protein
MTNEERSGRAMDALRDYRMEEDDFKENCIDLLTDLLHAAVHAHDYHPVEAGTMLQEALRMAEMHFEAEG